MKKKYIIAIIGQAKKGKTSTIRYIRSILEQWPEIQTETIEVHKERLIIISKDNFKIGIFKDGDPNTKIELKLEMLSEKGCDIIICSTRTRSKTPKAVINMKSIYDIIWTTNYRLNREDIEFHQRLNHLSAMQIVELIKLLIGNNNEQK